KDRAQLKPGETLAVLGAAGGTGLATIELGKLMAARVIACASSAEKLAFAREHGADEAINYVQEDLKDALRRVTDGKGVDVVYDPVGGPYAEPAVRALAWGGRFLVIGFAAGEIPKIPTNLVLLRSSAIVGVFWGAWAERNPQAHQGGVRRELAASRPEPHALQQPLELGLELDQGRDRRRGGDHRSRPAAAERSQAVEAQLERPPVDLIEQRRDLVGEHVIDVADEAQRQVIVLRVDPARARQAAAQHGERKRDLARNLQRGEKAGHSLLRTREAGRATGVRNVRR